MKLVITEKEQGKIIAKQTVIKLVVNPFSYDAGKIPLSLFEAKGDLIAGKGASNPVRVAVGSDGQVLVADSGAVTGLRWKTQQLGTTELTNNEAIAVTAGTVVTSDGVAAFRVATNADTTTLYVAAENIPSGAAGVVYTVQGASCMVKVTSGAIVVGDLLKVSSTDGVAEAADPNDDWFATAVTAKAAGLAGTVIAILKGTSSGSGGGGGADIMTIFLFS
jgi:hypothetical protein